MKRQKKIFTYEEAVRLLPQVRDLTDEAAIDLERLLEQHVVTEQEDIGAATAAEYQRIVGAWAERVLDLGVEVKGLWLVDFDSGSGYYCWKHPEPALEHFHEYEEGFGGRVKLN